MPSCTGPLRAQAGAASSSRAAAVARRTRTNAQGSHGGKGVGTSPARAPQGRKRCAGARWPRWCARRCWTMPGQANAADGRRDAAALRARHVGVVRRDDRRAAAACPPTCSRATAARSVQTSTTNIGAYMWSAVAAERLGIIAHAELVARADADARRRSSAWSATRRAASSTTGTTTATAPSSRTGRRPARRWTRSSPPSTTRWLATGLRIVAQPRAASSPRARGAIYDSMDFGFYYVPDAEPDPVPLLARDRAPARAATTRSSPRAGSPTTSGSPRASCRARSTTAAGARSRTPATTRSRRRARAASTAATTASASTRAAIRTAPRG